MEWIYTMCGMFDVCGIECIHIAKIIIDSIILMFVEHGM
jgi:hypothetical protein